MTTPPKKRTGKRIVIGLVVAAALIGGAAFFMKDSIYVTMARHMMGGGHDEVNMPGLRGKNASPEESEEIAVLFRNFETITRTVENLPNGIRTATLSSDEEVMAQLVSHVTGMINRVEELDDPKIIIQSRTLDIFFVRGKVIETDIDVTDEGIVVTQTSENPELVVALQTHAAEVSAMAERGMDAVHDMMMGDTH
jgi:hypothetical protein